MKYFRPTMLVLIILALAGCTSVSSSRPAATASPVPASVTPPAPSATAPSPSSPTAGATTAASPSLAPAVVRTPTRTPTAVPQGLKKSLDIPYVVIQGVDPNLTSLDIYAPQTSGSWPVLVMIHGGAWVEGDKSNYNNTFYKPAYFTAQGFVYISINYRLSPAVIHPAHVQDVARAIAWVAANIQKYNGDPQRIFLMGHSAGAHLAALAAVDERYLQIHDLGLDAVKGVILLDGAGYDIPKLMKVNDGLQEMYTTAFGEKPAAWKDASPISYIAPGKSIPPFLLFSAGARPASFVLSNDLAQALQRAGVRAEVETEPDKNHGTITGDIGRPGDPVTAKIMQFLASLLD